MPGTNTTGGDIADHLRADIVGQVVCGQLSIQDACTRYQLSRERIVEWVAAYRHASLTAFDDQLRRTLAEQGVDASALGCAEFQGDLAELTIADLIQTLTLGQREGVIAVAHDGHVSHIWCAGGEVVDAESGKLVGAPAVHRLLALEQGRVRASFTRVQRPRRLNVSTMELLLDGARRSDEARSLRSRLGSGLYRVAPHARPAAGGSSEREHSVLRLFDVPLSAADVLAESELGDLETLTLLCQLVTRADLVPDGDASPAPLCPSPADSRPPVVLSVANGVAPRRPRRWRVATLGLGALGIACWLAPRYLASPDRGPPLPAPSAVAARPAVDSVEHSVEHSVERSALAPLPDAALTPTATAIAPATAAAARAVAGAGAASEAPPPARLTSAARRRAPRSRVAVPAAALEPGTSPSSRSDPVASTSTSAASPNAAPRMQIIEGQLPRMQILE